MASITQPMARLRVLNKSARNREIMMCPFCGRRHECLVRSVGTGRIAGEFQEEVFQRCVLGRDLEDLRTGPGQRGHEGGRPF